MVFDNHESHVVANVISRLKEVGIVLLPPHCSHNLQSLDHTIYGPSKLAYNRVSDEFILRNPGKTITPLVN